MTDGTVLSTERAESARAEPGGCKGQRSEEYGWRNSLVRAIRQRGANGQTLVLALVGSIGVGALLLVLVGESPGAAYSAMLRGAFGSWTAIGETLVRAAALATVGLGVAVALRAGVFTIGAEGQLIVGAVGAALMIFWLDFLPGPLLLAISAVGAAVFGAGWALVPAVLRARWRVNEILSTLIFTYLAFFFLGWLLRAPMKPPNSPISQSEVLPRDARLPVILPESRLHLGVLLVILLVAGFALWTRTISGFRINLYGQNPVLARQLGIAPRKTILAVMLVAGVLAGLAGWLQVAGLHHRVYTDVSSDVGFLGILVAVLGGLRAVGIVGAAILLGALGAGGVFMEQTVGIPATMSDVLQALILLAFAAQLRLPSWRRRPRPADGDRVPQRVPGAVMPDGSASE